MDEITASPLLAFDLIVFDWDGTLFDSIAPIVRLINDAKSPVASMPDAVLLQLSGLLPVIDQLLRDEQAIQLNDLQLILELAGLARVFQHAELYEGIGLLLQKLHELGYKLALISGRMQAEVHEELSRLAIGHYFSCIMCADKKRIKPDPAILLDVVRQVNCEAARTLMVGDSALDMEMAMLADVARMGTAYLTGHNPDYYIQCLKPWEPLAIARSVVELQGLLLGHS